MCSFKVYLLCACVIDLQHTVQMVLFAWLILAVSMPVLAGLKSALAVHGEQFVISIGTIEMPVSYADSLDTQNMVCATRTVVT